MSIRRIVNSATPPDAETWNLRKARRAFYASQGLGEEVNFWRQLAGGPLLPIDADDPQYRPLLEWRPAHANCPELNAVIEDIARSAPELLKARFKNLFVARTVDSDANAYAWRCAHTGVVELSWQLSVALEGYAAAHDRTFEAVRQVIASVDASLREGLDHELLTFTELNQHAFHNTWAELDRAGMGWRDPTQVAGISRSLGQLPSWREADTRANVIRACERWIICHEVAHHVLGHTGGKKTGGRIQERLWQYMHPAGIGELLVQRGVSSLTVGGGTMGHAGDASGAA
jgi:hypothetical protein